MVVQFTTPEINRTKRLGVVIISVLLVGSGVDNQSTEGGADVNPMGSGRYTAVPRVEGDLGPSGSNIVDTSVPRANSTDLRTTRNILSTLPLSTRLNPGVRGVDSSSEGMDSGPIITLQYDRPPDGNQVELGVEPGGPRYKRPRLHSRARVPTGGSEARGEAKRPRKRRRSVDSAQPRENIPSSGRNSTKHSDGKSQSNCGVHLVDIYYFVLDSLINDKFEERTY